MYFWNSLASPTSSLFLTSLYFKDIRTLKFLFSPSGFSYKASASILVAILSVTLIVITLTHSITIQLKMRSSFCGPTVLIHSSCDNIYHTVLCTHNLTALYMTQALTKQLNIFKINFAAKDWPRVSHMQSTHCILSYIVSL